MPTAEILSQGDELLTGQIADTNAAWLSEQLTRLGFSVRRHTSVGDHLDDIRDLLCEASRRVDVCIGTGGLGPTSDDLTADAVARAFDRPLALDPVALQAIRRRYAQAGRRMPEVNEKQAWLPSGATRLDNDWGTAPGFAVHDGAYMAFLPGVPSEMREMFTHHVEPELRSRFGLRPSVLVTLRTTGVGESTLAERIGAFREPGVTLSYRTRLPENHVKLRFEPDVPQDRRDRIVAEVSRRIGTPLFSVDTPSTPGGSLARVVGDLLGARGETLAVAESCTGGRLGAACTAVPGASAWFLEGVVTYADQAKIRRLGVRPQDLQAHGAVSEPVARQMAACVREQAGATYGLSTTGIAGPGGGSDAKPVGLVHVALATPEGQHHRALRLTGDRERIQRLATAGALDLLRRHLQHKL